jgi:membrane associated rhomboid family serine protease
MGYQDRDYFRNQKHPYWALLESTRACWGIILAHVIIFLIIVLAQDGRHSVEDALRLDPHAMVQHWQLYRLLTASFVVDNPWHLGFALLLVWLIGQELEVIYGSLEFLTFYIIANVIGNLSQFLALQFAFPNQLVNLTVIRGEGGELGFLPFMEFGPSSAALSLLFIGVLHYPYRMVTYLFVPMQMWIFGLIALAVDLFFFMQNVPAIFRLAVHGPTLLWALSYQQFNWRLWRDISWPPRFRRPLRRQLAPIAQSRPKSVKLVLEEEFSDLPVQRTPRVVDEQLEAKMDAVLEKVGKSGMDSLTEEEKNTLKHASEVLRKKNA